MGMRTRLDHAVELGALVMQFFAVFQFAFLTCTQGTEILGRLGRDVIEEFKD